MSDTQIAVVPVDLATWVEAARSNPILYAQRQVTEIVLTAIGLSDMLSEGLVLKGGALMALAFKSERATGDVDFTAKVPPEDLVDQLRDELNRCIPESMENLGYLDLHCAVQSVKKRPKPQNFENLDCPALDVSVGYALKKSPQEKGFLRGQATNILSVEITFKDQVYQFQELHLSDPKICVKAFSINEIFSEKARALIQQKSEYRNRYRRQDIFDLWYLLQNHREHINPETTLEIFTAKCAGRGITSDRNSFDDPEVYDRAKADWETISLEIGDLPPFDECYNAVRNFYRSLPW